MTAIAPSNEHAVLWAQLWQVARQAMHKAQAHPARTVLLLPFFQLQVLARQTWGSSSGAGQNSHFLPRIETTKSWQQRLANFEPQEIDMSFDAGLDSLRARQWIAQAGLAEHSRVLTPMLVEAAQQLGGLAACVLPAQRADWAARLRPELLQGVAASFAKHEAAVAQIALAWAAASSYASDVLLEPSTAAQVDLLIVVRGVQRNEFTHRLAEQIEQAKPGSVSWLDLPQAGLGQLFTHAAQDAEDEAQRACACVLQAISRGQVPVALPAIDRQATRRISAMLHERGVAVADETGWRLSTTRAAASLMSLLRAAHPLATLDERLDWLKHTDADAQAVQRWEKELRGQNKPVAVKESAQSAITFIASGQKPDAVISTLQSARSIASWIEAMRDALQACGQWQTLKSDEAGQQVLQALQLDRAQPSAIVRSDAARMSLPDLSQWVQAALEGASFKASASEHEPQVVILPLAQMAARPFACAVLAGADEVRLPLAPEPLGLWTRAQREALGMPSREQLALEQQTTWQRAMQLPQVHALWRQSQGDELMQPSPLLQAWQLTHAASAGEDARSSVAIEAQSQYQSAPSAAALATRVFSASSYADVRTCPYRYFALRLLGLQEAAELDDELSKREFGAWLHEVLSEFHRARDRETDALQDAELLDACAARLAAPLLQDAGFVPFAASWPQVRRSYLLWLAEHEAQGWRFEVSEESRARELGDVTLKGRLDRIDLLAGSGSSQRWVMDYKTEGEAALKKRVLQPLEDTQLVFYAALLGGYEAQEIQASYIAINEKSTSAVTQAQVNEALPLLLEGLADDAQRMLDGHALPALGEGKACEYCAARGLCRKDFWTPAA